MKHLFNIFILFVVVIGVITVDFSTIKAHSSYLQENNNGTWEEITWENYQNVKIDGQTVQRPITTFLNNINYQNEALGAIGESNKQLNVAQAISQMMKKAYGGVIQGDWGAFDFLRKGINLIIAPFILLANGAVLIIDTGLTIVNFVYQTIFNSIWY